MTGHARYHALRIALEAVEKVTGTDLTDISCDHENTMDSQDYTTGTPLPMVEEEGEYWEMMISQASAAAMYRADDAGFNINDHFASPIA